MEIISIIAFHRRTLESLIKSECKVIDIEERIEKDLKPLYKKFFESSNICAKFLQNDAGDVLARYSIFYPSVMEYLLEKSTFDIQKTLDYAIYYLAQQIEGANKNILLAKTACLILDYATYHQIPLTVNPFTSFSTNTFLHFFGNPLYKDYKSDETDRLLEGLIVISPIDFFTTSRVLKALDLKTLCYLSLSYEDYLLLQEFCHPIISLRFEYSLESTKKEVITIDFTPKVNRHIFENIKAILFAGKSSREPKN